MENCILGFPNNIDASTLSGGSFVATMPRDRLQTTVIKECARTVDLALANTQFIIDQGERKNTRLLGIVNHNMSTAAKIRITGSNVADFSEVLVTTGWIDVWPIVYPYGTKEWEDKSWWGGRYSPEEIEGYVPTFSCLLDASWLLRYVKVEIDDHTNTTPYIDMGRIFLSPVWQPAVNMSWGESIGWETDTEVQKARGGAEYFNRTDPYRVARFKLEHIKRNVAMTTVFEMLRRAGIDKEVFWIEDPSDTTNVQRTRFMGRMRTLNPLEYPYVGHNSTAFEIKERQ